MNRIMYGDNLPLLEELPSSSVDLIYIDPQFNTGKTQSRQRITTVRDGYDDSFDDYLGFLRPRLIEAHRILSATGSLFFHIDYREVDYCKVMLDEIFGRQSFQNEIIWAYDYGARSKSKWPAKHDNILWYSKDPERYTFNFDTCDRIPYMAPGLVGPEKAARGKTPTDVWWHTIVPTNGKEKTGYATQKPLGIVERIVKVHSNSGDMCLDFFAGSGTLGEAAAKNNRNFILIDSNPDAIDVMKMRLEKYVSPQTSQVEDNSRNRILRFQ